MQQKIIKLLTVINVIYGFTLNAWNKHSDLQIPPKKELLDIIFLAQVKYFLFQT